MKTRRFKRANCTHGIKDERAASLSRLDPETKATAQDNTCENNPTGFFFFQHEITRNSPQLMFKADHCELTLSSRDGRTKKGETAK